MERRGVVKVNGEPLTLIGKEIRTGEKGEDFVVLDNELKETRLSDFKGKIKLIASVPSLDTPICDLEIKRFNDEASRLSGELIIIFISMDLPFAEKRFCRDNKIKKVKTFSDHRDASFGQKFGVLIKESRLLARAIFILDKDDNIRYTEYVPDLTSHPNYDNVLAELKRLI